MSYPYNPQQGISKEMSFEIQVITDLAVVMVIASVVAFIFHKLRQPLIIGYLIAGMLIGPYTPPFNLITHTEFLNVFAEIGVVLLLFTIGLEFPIRKLQTMGRVVIGVSAIEITLMLIISWAVGNFLNWGFYNTLFLGAALASSSTTIIAKVLGDMGKLQEISSTIMLGILVVEDVVVVILLAMLQNIAVAQTISLTSSAWLITKLVVFIGGTLIVGGFFLPKLIDRFAKVEKQELLYILMLGICFAFAIMATQIGFSAAIGAFIIGVVVARSRCREEINREIGPFKIVFGAIFFVSMGALMDISQIAVYWVPAVVITLAVLLTKLASCGFGTRLFGYDKKTSLRVGLGMAQIGEFAFIVAKSGQDLGVISDFVLPIIGVATIITAFVTPYLIKLSFRVPKNRWDERISHV
ncbi:MAG: cation:proton antiporter [Candidatus Bathyarchaeota archaeon]|nr:cation:proton antiporter [Candidatus Bathyarchaeota archaeon]